MFILIFSQKLSLTIDQALKRGWFEPSIEYHSAPVTLESGSRLSFKNLNKKLIQRNYTLQKTLPLPKKGERMPLDSKQCQKKLRGQKFEQCLLWGEKSPRPLTRPLKRAAGFSRGRVFFFEGPPFSKIKKIHLEPLLFAQYEGPHLRMRKKLKLPEAPYLCLQALTSAEDHRFLLHKGASIKAIARAFLKNLRHIRVKEGGSTITQQLVKNRFLTPDKTLKRKLKELLMALILETKLSKDEILELYLNTVYMGQTGAYGIYGFRSAGEYYFNTPLSRLNTAQCAMLSAMVRSPGNLNPFSNPEKAKMRRDFILKKMAGENILSKKKLKEALAQPLPVKSQKIKIAKAPYFIQTASSQVQKFLDPFLYPGLSLKVITTIDIEIQEKAKQAAQNLKLFKKDPDLEAALIFVDLKTNEVRALIGGRHFLKSQFNRAHQARRPIGSLVKPFVFLSALINKKNLTPLSLFEDRPLNYSGWSPKNYKNKYYGEVPLYFALKESLNSVSVSLAQKTKVKNIKKTMRALGYKGDIPSHLALALGSVDLSLLELTQMYTTLARFGSYQPLSMVKEIQLEDGQVLYSQKTKSNQKISKQKAAVLLGMMREVMRTGTAGWTHPFWPHPSAGKTGTSNEERDSWFIGFTPRYLTAIWVGRDDNTPHGLTGASGALTLWLYFMKSLDLNFSKNFKWPRGTKEKKAPLLKKHKLPESLDQSPDQKQGEGEFFSVRPSDKETTKLIFESPFKIW